MNRTAAHLRDRVGLLHDDINDTHRTIQDYDLKERADAKKRNDEQSLLKELATKRGMAWTDIARVVGVSVSAVRKWRKDGNAAPEKRVALARIAALLDLLEDFAIQDPVGWLEMPMVDDYTVRPMDLLQAGHHVALLEYAAMRKSAEETLTEVEPNWREVRTSSFRVVEAADGNLSIEPKA